jgi:hypothetical protein
MLSADIARQTAVKSPEYSQENYMKFRIPVYSLCYNSILNDFGLRSSQTFHG